MEPHINTISLWNVLCTAPVGTVLGNALGDLIETYSVQNIHLIGHSVGAHVAGVAGRTFTAGTGKRLRRITGLDPAKSFDSGKKTRSTLGRGDAEFVDIYHSGPGELGKLEHNGNVDLYLDR